MSSIISAVFIATGILKWVILAFLLFWKIIFSEWNRWVNFLNNISLLSLDDKFKTLYLHFLQIYKHQTYFATVES